MAFQPGDIVVLKSGSVPMTVDSIGEHYSVTGEAIFCVWAERAGGKQILHTEAFSVHVLKKFEEPTPSFGGAVNFGTASRG